jgi:hypothetical protein
MSNRYFYQLDNIPTLGEKYINEGITGKYQLPPPENDNIRTPRTIKAKTTFANSALVQDLQKNLSPNLHVCFIRNDPHSCYDWHNDSLVGNRKCVINYLLSAGTGAITLFRQPVSRITYKITECPYVLYTPMLLNVAHDHCVINNSTDYRYILSVSLPDVTFDQAVEFFKSYRFFEE